MGDWPLLVVVTVASKPAPRWSECGRAFMDMDGIDPQWHHSDMEESAAATATTTTITAKVEFPFEEQRSRIVVWEENQSTRGSCSQSRIDLPYWNHFIVYRCCSLRPGSAGASIKAATLMWGTTACKHSVPQGSSLTRVGLRSLMHLLNSPFYGAITPGFFDPTGVYLLRKSEQFLYKWAVTLWCLWFASSEPRALFIVVLALAFSNSWCSATAGKEENSLVLNWLRVS